MANTGSPGFFPTRDLRVGELLRLVGDLHFFERRRRDENTLNFSDVIGSALLHREERRTVILRRNLEQPAHRNLVIAA